MARAARGSGDGKLGKLFADFDGRLVSPGGAAQLLGLARKTVHTRCARGELRAFRGDEDAELNTLGCPWMRSPVSLLLSGRIESVGETICSLRVSERGLRLDEDHQGLGQHAV